MSRPGIAPDTGVESSQDEQHAPLFHCVLLDDNDHSYDYVVEMLERLFFCSAQRAFEHAVEVDTSGRTIVITCEQPQAEYAQAQIHAHGADWRMPRSKGSMSAVVEPAGP